MEIEKKTDWLYLIQPTKYNLCEKSELYTLIDSLSWADVMFLLSGWIWEQVIFYFYRLQLRTIVDNCSMITCNNLQVFLFSKKLIENIYITLMFKLFWNKKKK